MASEMTFSYARSGLRYKQLGHDLYGTASDQTLSFVYNPASQIVTRTSANDTYAWTDAYDVNAATASTGSTSIRPPAPRASATTPTAI